MRLRTYTVAAITHLVLAFFIQPWIIQKSAAQEVAHPRVAWVSHAAALGSIEPAKLAESIAFQDIEIESSGDPLRKLRLIRCDLGETRRDQQQVLGASGRWLELPDESYTHAYRGVLFGEERPHDSKREQWLKRTRQSSKTNNAPKVDLPVLRSWQLPTDVLAWRDAETHQCSVAFDWDSDLRISEDETFRFTHKGQVQTRCLDDCLFCVQVDDEKLGETGIDIDWISLSRGKQDKSYVSLASVFSEFESTIELVFARVDRGVPDVVAACVQLDRKEIDLLVVDLEALSVHPTTAARLLCRLADQLSCPIIVNQRTIYTPRFEVSSVHLTGKEVSENAFALSNDAMDQRRGEEFIVTAIRQAIKLPVTDGEVIDLLPFLAERKPELFPIPNDWTDVSWGNRIRMSSLRGSLYDSVGNRVGQIQDRSNGVWFDRLPPVLLSESSGGQFSPEMGTAMPSNGEPRWHQSDRVVQRAVASVGSVIHVWSPGRHDKSGVGDRSQQSIRCGRRYAVHDPQSLAEGAVPDAIHAAASVLVERRGVSSWWYRLDDSIADGSVWHFLVDELNGPLQPDQSLFSLRLFSSRGTLSKSLSLGEAFTSEAETWLLLQAPGLLEVEQPPKLIRIAAAPIDDAQFKRSPATRHLKGTFLSKQPIGKHSLFELLAETPDTHCVGWVWADVLGSTSPLPTWKQFYIDDPMQQTRRVVDELGLGDLHTESPPVRSLNLFDSREKLLRLDHPATRKKHLPEIIELCDRVLKSCESRLGPLPKQSKPNFRSMLESMGQSRTGSSPPSRRLSSQGDARWYAWAVDAAYRKVRAVGYRELPEVVAITPIADQELQASEYADAFALLNGLVDIRDPDFVLPWVRLLRRNGKPSEAYKVLSRYGVTGPASAWFLKKQRDLWTEAGVETLARAGHARWFAKEQGLHVPMESL